MNEELIAKCRSLKGQTVVAQFGGMRAEGTLANFEMIKDGEDYWLSIVGKRRIVDGNLSNLESIEPLETKQPERK